MRERTLLVGSITVVAAAVGFAMLGPLARFAYDAGMEPFSFVAWRAAFGTLIVAIYAALRISRGRRFVAPWRLPGRQGWFLALAALTAITLNVASFIAFGRTTIALVLLGFYTYPAFVAAIAVARGDERLDAIRATALVVSLAGMVLVVAGGLDPSGPVRADALGIALALVAALSQTVFVTISRHGYSSMPTDQAMGWMLAATMVSSAAIALGTGAAAQLVLPLTSGQALAIAAVAGLFGAGIPSLFFLTGIRTIGGTRTGILMLFEPLGGVLLAALLLDERLQPIQAVGGAAILGAALLLQRSAADVEPAPTMRAGPGVVPGAER
jgi:DME family drug/metabolite transporter